MPEDIIPYLQEHQSVDAVNTTSPAGYVPDEEEKKTLSLVRKLFDKAKKNRAQYDQKWLDFYKMFRGRQWKEQRPTYRHSEVINMVFQNIQSVIPILTDSRPKIEYIPEEPSDIELSNILNEVSESDWIRNNWLMQLTEVLYDSHFYGAGFGCVEYDPKANFGLGSVTFKSSDPFYTFPDPNAVDVNKQSDYYMYAKPTDLAEIKVKWDKGKYVKPDLMDLIQGNKTDLDLVRFRSPVDNQTVLEGTSAYEAKEREQALLITAWIKDNEEVEEEVKSVDDTGSESTKYVQKLKYPNGRKVVVAGGIVLEDGPNPFDDMKFPYARLVNYMLPREFWGISEVEQLAGPQRIFNKLVSFALDVLTLMGNPIWIVDNTSGIDTDNLFNRPGLIVEKEPNSQVRREEGVQLQPYVLQLIDRMKNWFDDISGVNESSRGIRPEGITAGIAITSLQEASQQRLRLKTRYIDAFLQDIGQMYQSRIFQFWTVPKIVRITNKGGADKYFKFHVEDSTDEQGNPIKVAKVRDFIMGANNNVTMADEKQYQIRGSFDVRVSTGSTLPFSKQERVDKAFKLYELQVIDAEELLKDIDYPNYQSILARMKERQAQQAQMQPPPK